MSMLCCTSWLCFLSFDRNLPWKFPELFDIIRGNFSSDKHICLLCCPHYRISRLPKPEKKLPKTAALSGPKANYLISGLFLHVWQSERMFKSTCRLPEEMLRQKDGKKEWLGTLKKTTERLIPSLTRPVPMNGWRPDACGWMFPLKCTNGSWSHC